MNRHFLGFGDSPSGRFRLKTLKYLGVGAMVLWTASCGGGSGGQAIQADGACAVDASDPRLTTAEMTASGPFSVGGLQLVLTDSSRPTMANGSYAGAPDRTIVVQVWYPAIADGDSQPLGAGGPFPLLLYSHGLTFGPSENPDLARHLASHGYVVAAPQYPLSYGGAPGGATVSDIANQPGDASFVIDSILGLGDATSGVLSGGIDAARIAAAGYSLGGLTTLLLTYHPTLRDPRIRVAVELAAPAGFFSDLFYDNAAAPLLVVDGTIEAVLSYELDSVPTFERANPPVELVGLRDGTHAGFVSSFETYDDSPTIPNVDALLCAVIYPSGPPTVTTATNTFWQGLIGGDPADFVPGPPENGCAGPFAPSMLPSRQIELTKASVLSFLESTLAADPRQRGRACAYREQTLPGEADVEYRRR